MPKHRQLDTRTKIITPARAVEISLSLCREGVPTTAVVGYFDILTPDRVRRVNELASESARLFVVVRNPERALLTQGARAELIAALAMVDYVVPVPDDAAELLHHMNPTETVHDEEADAERTARMIVRVRARHGQASPGGA